MSTGWIRIPLITLDCIQLHMDRTPDQRREPNGQARLFGVLTSGPVWRQASSSLTSTLS